MRAAKLESRLAVLTKGYVTREAALRKEIEVSWQAVQTANQVRSCANLADLHTAADVGYLGMCHIPTMHWPVSPFILVRCRY